MEAIQLQAEKRRVLGKKVRHLRREGFVPAILYGHKTDPIPLKVKERDLRPILAEAGVNQLISLQIGRARKPRMILAREIQRDAISHALLHVDFYEVVMSEKITTEIPLVLVGESPIVERGEGMLVRGIDYVEAECLPDNLMQSVEVDISTLEEIDHTIHVSDLQVNPGIDILTDGEEIVVKVLPLQREEIVEVEEVEEAEVEVIAKPKKEKPSEVAGPSNSLESAG